MQQQSSSIFGNAPVKVLNRLNCPKASIICRFLLLNPSSSRPLFHDAIFKEHHRHKTFEFLNDTFLKSTWHIKMFRT